MLFLLLLSSVGSGCASSHGHRRDDAGAGPGDVAASRDLGTHEDAGLAPDPDAGPGLDGLLGPGSYLVELLAEPGSGLRPVRIRMDVQEPPSNGMVLFHSPWVPTTGPYVLDPPGPPGEHDLVPGACAICYPAWWRVELPDGATAEVAMDGLDGFAADARGIRFDASRGRAAIRHDTLGALSVPIRILPDDEPPILRWDGPRGPLLPFEAVGVRFHEPVEDPSADWIAFDTRVEREARPERLSRAVRPRGWWPPGEDLRVRYLGGHRDAAGNDPPPDEHVIPVASAPVVQGGGGPVNVRALTVWASAMSPRADGLYLEGDGGPVGVFGAIRLDGSIRSVAMELSLCGPDPEPLHAWPSSAFVDDGEHQSISTLTLTPVPLHPDGQCEAPVREITVSTTRAGRVGDLGWALRLHRDTSHANPAAGTVLVLHRVVTRPAER
ncbi:MAG: hypothetical protein ACFCGT_06165 [Sandaracinaceae bacterium]